MASDAQVLAQVLVIGDLIVPVSDAEPALEDGHGDAGAGTEREKKGHRHRLERSSAKIPDTPAKPSVRPGHIANHGEQNDEERQDTLDEQPSSEARPGGDGTTVRREEDGRKIETRPAESLSDPVGVRIWHVRIVCAVEDCGDAVEGKENLPCRAAM